MSNDVNLSLNFIRKERIMTKKIVSGLQLTLLFGAMVLTIGSLVATRANASAAPAAFFCPAGSVGDCGVNETTGQYYDKPSGDINN
jgi:hypothetical protein